MMMGPSAPKGPPVPIDSAADKRLEDGKPWLHFAAADQNGFDGLRDAVAANAFRAVTRHQADDQAAGDGHQHGPPAQMVPCGRDQCAAEALVIKEIGEEPDQAQQRQRHARPNQSDHDGHHGDGQHANGGSEVAQLFKFG